MRNFFRTAVLLLAIGTCFAFAAHKFYVGIYQINYAPQKKMLQITSRLFIDDINDVLQKKYNRKFHIGEPAESPDEVKLMQNYIISNFQISVNKKPVTINYLSNEIENNVLICYFNVRDIPKPITLHVTNKIMFDLVTEQQNIIQTTVGGKKSSLLLTFDNPEGTLSFN